MEWVILGIIFFSILNGLFSAIEETASKEGAPKRRGSGLPFNWRRTSEVVRGLFPVYRHIVGHDLAFFRAIVAPLAGRLEIVKELYEAPFSGNTQLTNLLRALYYWYGQCARQPIEKWKPDMQHYPTASTYFDALVAFLFEKHPVPTYIAQVWWMWRETGWQEFIHLATPAGQETEGKDANNVAFQLYFYLTQGGNPAKAPFLQWEPGRGAVRYFLEAPAGLSPRQAYWRAIYLAEGGREADLSPNFFPAPQGFGETAFWRDFYRLLAGTKAFDPWEAQRVISRIEWLRSGDGRPEWNGLYDGLRGAEPVFSFKGRTWRSLVRHLTERFRFQPPLGMQRCYERTGAEGQPFVIRLLDTPAALDEEAQAMNHCLGDEEHVQMATQGVESYWSLRRLTEEGQEERLATFTLYQGVIAEQAGYRNSEPEQTVNALLQEWLAEVHPEIPA